MPNLAAISTPICIPIPLPSIPFPITLAYSPHSVSNLPGVCLSVSWMSPLEYYLTIHLSSVLSASLLSIFSTPISSILFLYLFYSYFSYFYSILYLFYSYLLCLFCSIVLFLMYLLLCSPSFYLFYFILIYAIMHCSS